MLEKIRTLNPDYQIHELDDSFKEYGRIIKQDMQEAIDFATTYQNTNAYDTSVQVLEEMPCMQDLINDIYGLSVTKKMIEIKNENEDYQISGYISYPELQKSNKNAITLLVNGRVIRNLDIIRYITDSYHTYIPQDRYPIVVMKIDVDPILVDVNVHPTKMDIKFSKMDTLKDLITKTITSKLESLTLIPDAILETTVDENRTRISTVYTPDRFQEFDENKKVLEGNTEFVLRNEKVLKKLGYGLPFVVDLSIQLIYYDILGKVYYDMDKLTEDLWN